jgi:hypothetical protein
MKFKLITSIASGVSLPWLYFAVVTVGPARYMGGEVGPATGERGVAGFIEFHGAGNAMLIYLKAIVLVAATAYAALSVYSYLKARHATKA